MDLSDLSLFYTDFTVPVTHTPLVGSVVTAQAIFDQPGVELLGGEVLSTDYALRYPATAFKAVKRGDKFLIGGATYTTREAGQPASIDGLEYIVPLAKS